MDKHSKYRPLLDKIQSEIMRAEVGVTGVYQYMLEALDGAETVEVALREELEALKKSIPKIRADAIRDMLANLNKSGTFKWEHRDAIIEDTIKKFADEIEGG
jgi:hypothetical protein